MSIPVEGFLVIVSCGSKKIWDRNRSAGPTAARSAYTSPVFNTSRRYAERFAESWLILSAKYGLIEPDFLIPQNYNASFYGSGAVSVSTLREQIATKQLDRFAEVGVLGSLLYWSRISEAFKGHTPTLHHVNGNKGFAPVFIKLVNTLIDQGVRFPWENEAGG